MTPSEKKWLKLFSLSFLLLTTLPYLFGYWMQGDQWRFTGFFLGVGDGNSYIAKMLLGTAGDWLFRTPYTAYPQNGFLAFFPYILLGKLASTPGEHEQLVALFQVFRWVGGGIMIFGYYQFFSFFFEEISKRRFCTLLATLSGGAGWFALLGLQSIWGSRIPLEFYSPETFGFLSFFTLPHLAMARGLLLLGLVYYWRMYGSTLSYRQAWFHGFLWLCLGLMQPLTALVGWGLIGLDLLVRFCQSIFTHRWEWIKPWRMILSYLSIVLVCSLPLILYTSISFLIDPFLKQWSVQNIILSPPPIDYLMAYLLMLPICLLGAVWIIKQKQERFYPLLGWIFFVPILAYFPVAIQRRLPEGSWAAWIAVTVFGMSFLKRNIRIIYQFFLYTGLLTTLLLFLGSFLTITQLKTPVYRPAEEIQAFEFIRQTSISYPVVMASFDTSNAVPAWAPVRTLIGHGPESMHLAQVQPKVEAYYQGRLSTEEETRFFQEFGISYIIWGPAERELGNGNIVKAPSGKLVFQNTTYQVFEVVP